MNDSFLKTTKLPLAYIDEWDSTSLYFYIKKYLSNKQFNQDIKYESFQKKIYDYSQNVFLNIDNILKVLNDYLDQIKKDEFISWFNASKNNLEQIRTYLKKQYGINCFRSWTKKQFEEFNKLANINLNFDGYVEIRHSKEQQQYDRETLFENDYDKLCLLEWFKYAQIFVTRHLETETKKVGQINIDKASTGNKKYSLQDVDIILINGDEFNNNKELISSFSLQSVSTNQNQLKIHGQIKIKINRVEIKDQQGQLDYFLQLNFNNLSQNPLYYRVFCDEVQENDTYLIKNSGYKFTLLEKIYNKDEGIMEYSMMVDLVSERFIFEVKQYENEEKRIGRYVESNELYKDNKYQFSSIKQLNSQVFTRNFGIFLVKNGKLIIKVSSKDSNQNDHNIEKQELFKEIKTPSLIMISPYIQIMYNQCSNSVILAQCLQDSKETMHIRNCGHQNSSENMSSINENGYIEQSINCSECKYKFVEYSPNKQNYIHYPDDQNFQVLYDSNSSIQKRSFFLLQNKEEIKQFSKNIFSYNNNNNRNQQTGQQIDTKN